MVNTYLVTHLFMAICHHSFEWVSIMALHAMIYDIIQRIKQYSSELVDEFDDNTWQNDVKYQFNANMTCQLIHLVLIHAYLSFMKLFELFIDSLISYHTKKWNWLIILCNYDCVLDHTHITIKQWITIIPIYYVLYGLSYRHIVLMAFDWCLAIAMGIKFAYLILYAVIYQRQQRLLLK